MNVKNCYSSKLTDAGIYWVLGWRNAFVLQLCHIGRWLRQFREEHQR